MGIEQFRFTREDTNKLVQMKDQIDIIEKAIKDADECEIDTNELKTMVNRMKKQRTGMLKHYAFKE